MAKQATEQRWRDLIREQRQSGLSIAEFCRKNGFSANSLYFWRKKLAVDEPAKAFVPLAIVDSQGAEVEFPCGAILRLPPGDERALQLALFVLRQKAEEGAP